MFSPVGNPKVVFDFKSITPLPVIIHLTIDTDGRLYCSNYRNGKVMIVDPL